MWYIFVETTPSASSDRTDGNRRAGDVDGEFGVNAGNAYHASEVCISYRTYGRTWVQLYPSKKKN